MAFTVYILASGRNGTIYIGHTDDLYRRMVEHRAHHFKGFTAKYAVSSLVGSRTMRIVTRPSNANSG